MPYLRVIIWSVVVIFCIGLFSVALHTKSKPRSAQVTTETQTGQALIGGPFKLIDQKGRVRHSSDFKNKYLLVYFGYSYCPDICPTALSNITQAMKQLSYKRGAVQPIFVSVDPDRDTPEHLALYMENFDDKFVALTGAKEDIEAAKKAYRVYSNKVDPEKTETTDYLIDHSSIVYFMAPGGDFIAHFNHETPPEKMAEVISSHVR